METIGIDVGGTKMAVGVVDDSLETLYESGEPTTGMTTEALLAALGRQLGDAAMARPDVVAAGIGIPCTIDRERGIAIGATNLDIVDVPIRDLMTESAGMPVFIDNDGNLAALAEQLYGAAKGARNVVMVTVGTGIGGGLIIDGEVYRGSHGSAAELGHTIIEMDGPPCQGNCPGHGCVETLASGTALGREGRESAAREPDSALGRLLADGVEIVGRHVSDAAMAGDGAAIAVIELIGSRLGVALTSFANIFEPEVIVVGGGVITIGEMLLAPAREMVRTRALPPMNETPVLVAKLGPAAGMIGAAAMARIEMERNG